MLLNDTTRNEVRTLLQVLTKEVQVLVFTQKNDCALCQDSKNLAEEVAELSDKIHCTVYDFLEDQAVAMRYKIDKIPAIAIVGEEDYGIRFYGIPAGYEFMSFLEAIKLVSTGETALSADTVSFLSTLREPVHLQVFVSTTCPYCPGAVVMAHQMAYLGKTVTASMVEGSEFPHLIYRYGVEVVPKIIINETFSEEGVANESLLVEKIKEAVKG